MSRLFDQKEWKYSALVAYGNILLFDNMVNERIIKNGDTIPPTNHVFEWVSGHLQQSFEDEIGYAQSLLAEDSDLEAIFYSCSFANGEELTGDLQEYIDNTD